MPTYDYHCEKCKETFEVRQSMKDPHLAICPQELCRMATWGRGRVKRAMGSGAGLIFKGSGFYTTDYRSEGYKQAAQKESAGNTTPAAGGGDSATATPKPTTPQPAAPAKPDKPTKSAKSAKPAATGSPD